MSAGEAAALLAQEASKIAREPVELSEWMLYKMEQQKASIPAVIADAAKIIYPHAADKLTSVYYNASSFNREDNGPDERTRAFTEALAARTTIRARVLLGAGASVWSVKGMTTETIDIFAAIGGNREIVKIGSAGLGNIRPRSLLIFEPDPHPHENIWLLVQSKTDPDKWAIRFIEPGGNLLISLDKSDKPLKLTEWHIRGFAWAEAPQKGMTYPDFNVRMNGIEPKK